MKRIVLLIGTIIILSFVSLGVYWQNGQIFNDNKKHFEYFKEERLVGVDGRINLTGINSLKDSLYNEILILFQQEGFDYNAYLKVIEGEQNNNQNLQMEIDSLSKQISDLEKKKGTLSSEYATLEKKYNNLKKVSNVGSTSNKTNNYNFPLINQYPKYQTGCESVALTMLLQYYGVNVTPDMIISKLRKGSLPYYENGKTYGGNPEVEFVGNPYSKSAYGVYEKPIAEVANVYKSGINIRNNFSFNEVVNLVQKGTPVMVWTSMGLSLPYISHTWIYKPTMEVINWKANEHAVVMVGANSATVTVADPMGGVLKVYNRSLFEQRYNYFGKKALYY